MVNALVVEDEADSRGLLVLELQDRGYQVQEAGNGNIAMQIITERKPDIIFVDLMMPVMDGFELISNLRGNPTTSETSMKGLSSGSSVMIRQAPIPPET